VNVHVPDDALLVDDEDRPLGDPLGPEDVVKKGHVSVGPEVTENGEGCVKALGPGLQGGQVVDEHTQNLSVEVRETRLQFLVRGHLAASCRGESRRQKGDQHVLLAPEFAECDLSPLNTGQ